jgi:D-alanyl-D-alanine carboxypeptidase
VKLTTRFLAAAALGVAALMTAGSTALASPSVADETIRVPVPSGSSLPTYVATIKPVTAERLGSSWHEGCPVGPDQLRLVDLSVVGFDGAVHRGELVVDQAVAAETAYIFADLYYQGFPIEKMETVEKYDSDDDKSMAANNTSAFNCRAITGGTEWSNHSYGRAIDINPVQNPYISDSGAVYPPNGEPYTDRTRTDPGLIHAGDATVQAFDRRGWTWGGSWETPIDYQHFEKP